MRTFTYTARGNSLNKVVHATVQAESERDAAKLLIAQDLSPLMISEKVEGGIMAKIFGHKAKRKDKIAFTRQFATLIEAGLPVTQSLHTIIDQTSNEKMRDIIQDIANAVEGGKSLADAFALHPKMFDKVYLALVRAGEASGTLDKALKRIADQQEKDEAMLRKIRGALIYPAIVLIVIVLVIIFMLLTIVPQIKGLYEGLGQNLPLATQIMVWMADLITRFWWGLLIGLCLLIYFLKNWSKTESGIKTLDTVKLNFPMISKLFQKLYMARFTRTAETLLETGVPMIEMLDITSDAVNNYYIAQEIHKASERIQGGMAFSKSIEDSENFTSLVPQMIAIGEKSGRISQMLGKVANVYEDELEEQIKAISTVIEPILMVVMAAMAMFIVMAVLFPIYSLVGTNGTSIAK